MLDILDDTLLQPSLFNVKYVQQQTGEKNVNVYLLNINTLKTLAVYLIMDAAIFKIVQDVEKVEYIMNLVGLPVSTTLVTNNNKNSRIIELEVQHADGDTTCQTIHVPIIFAKPNKDGKRIIRNNSKTLLSNAKRMLQVWHLNDASSTSLFSNLSKAVQKCLELQVLYEFIKQRKWHAADEYCSENKNSLTPTPLSHENNNATTISPVHHLHAVLDMAKKEYSYLQLHNKHHLYKANSNHCKAGALQPELIDILKDVTIYEKQMKRKFIVNNHSVWI